MLFIHSQPLLLFLTVMKSYLWMLEEAGSFLTSSFRSNLQRQPVET